MKIRNVLAVPNSGNDKLGPGWGVTYRPVGPTCPSTCPLLNHGCYAERGRVALVQRRAASDYLTRLDGCARVRWDVSGDGVTSRGTLDRHYWKAKLAWHRRNPSGLSLGYTHAPQAYHIAGATPDTWPDGMHILASVHSIRDAEYWQDNGWTTARVVGTSRAKLMADEALCPYDLRKATGDGRPTTCATCGLCFAKDGPNIAFVKF